MIELCLQSGRNTGIMETINNRGGIAVPPILIAHRCGPGIFPEQSMAAAGHALSLGADMVEMDVRCTRDGIPVICHDANTARVFGADRLCSDMTLAEFRALRHIADSTYGAHTLEDVLKSGIRPLLLHCKLSGEILGDTVRRILDCGAQRACVIGVQQAGDVEIVKTACLDLRVLAFMPGLNHLDRFLESRAEIIRLWEDWVSPARIGAIHRAGKHVWVMAGQPAEDKVGITSAESLLCWARMGVDGILINDVRASLQVLDREPDRDVAGGSMTGGPTA